MGSTQKNVMKKPKQTMNKLAHNINKTGPTPYTAKAEKMMKKKPVEQTIGNHVEIKNENDNNYVWGAGCRGSYVGTLQEPLMSTINPMSGLMKQICQCVFPYFDLD